MNNTQQNIGFKSGKYVVFSGNTNTSNVERILKNRKTYTIVEIGDNLSEIEEFILIAIGKRKTPILIGIDTKKMSLQLRGLISAGLILVNPKSPSIL